MIKKPDNYDSTEAKSFGEYESIDPGAYICKIIGARSEDYNGKPRIVIAFDICEGEKAGFYKRKHDQFGKDWPGCYKQFMESKDGGCSPYFKGMITAIEESNGFKWNWDEKTLAGKLFGGIFGEEEYVNRMGDLSTIVRLSSIRSVQAVHDGNYAVPKKKPYKAKSAAAAPSSADGYTDINPDDIPF